MPKQKIAVVDFETERIDARPDYPPRPVGVSIRLPGAKVPKYYAWGHPTGNTATFSQGCDAVKKVWSDPNLAIAFHHAKFDQEVALVHMGLPLLPPERTHDTMLLAFLDNPYAWSLELKPLAEKELGEPPTERDELRDWIQEHVPEARQKKKDWGQYISKAPGDFVGRYANGDTRRTHGLLQKLLPRVQDERGMKEPYDRELRLMPILIRNEREGVSVDLPRLRTDVERYNRALQDVDAWIGKYLKTPELEVDKENDLANAIDRCGKAINGWLLTPTGKRSTSKPSLEHALDDSLLIAALSYRGSLATCLRTFMQPWLRVAERTGGRIHTQWHSTRGQDVGARTGRLSSSPNFQNIPTEFLDEIELFLRAKFFERLLKTYKVTLPPLPQVRSYIVSDGKGFVLCGRDYTGQELRVLAHYEDGVLADQYRENPNLDPHTFVADMIQNEYHVPLGANPRQAGKTLNFLKVYGGGVPKLALKLGTDLETAKRVMRAYMGVFPGLKDLNDEMRRRGRANEPIKTLGGRLYFAEPPRVIKGVLRSFEYKLLNYLVQGSSADMTKEAVIRYDSVRTDSRLLLTVHDEILIGSPRKAWKTEMKKLKDAMESIKLDVPLLSEGEYGERWTEMITCP